MDNLIILLFGGFRRWDAKYFLHIAQHGYTYENTLAFFPLFPLLVRYLAFSLLWPLTFVMGISSVLLLSAVLINFVCFVVSAKVLFQLSKIMYQNERFAYCATQLYCLNPASIFFSAAYSESLFALLTFLALLYYEKKIMFVAAILFFLAGFVRANGTVNCGFFIFSFIHVVFTRYMLMKQTSSVCRVLTTVARIALAYAFYILICLVPFIIFQWYSFYLFCSTNHVYNEIPHQIMDYGFAQNYKVVHVDKPVWCNDSMPMPYNYVQSNHWNVGFLKYYQWKQIPNFILALPMTALCSFAILTYFRKFPLFCLSLGFCCHNFDKKIKQRKKNEYRSEKVNTRNCHSFYDPVTYVYVVQMAFLLLFGLLIMHVQVRNRFYILVAI